MRIVLFFPNQLNTFLRAYLCCDIQISILPFVPRFFSKLSKSISEPYLFLIGVFCSVSYKRRTYGNGVLFVGRPRLARKKSSFNPDDATIECLNYSIDFLGTDNRSIDLLYFFPVACSTSLLPGCPTET